MVGRLMDLVVTKFVFLMIGCLPGDIMITSAEILVILE